MHDLHIQGFIQALVAVGMRFDNFTTAKTVETSAKSKWLRNLRFNCLQEYHFGTLTLVLPGKPLSRKNLASD